jgi:hypothetical protein
MVEYLRSCGVGSDEIREVSVIPASMEAPDAVGNAFRCGVEHEWAPENMRSPLLTKWTAEDRVEIAYPERLEVIGNERSVRIEHQGEEATVTVKIRSIAREPK